MPGATVSAMLLRLKDFRLSSGHWWISNVTDKTGCASQKLAAPATDDDHRCAGVRTRSGEGMAARRGTARTSPDRSPRGANPGHPGAARANPPLGRLDAVGNPYAPTVLLQGEDRDGEEAGRTYDPRQWSPRAGTDPRRQLRSHRGDPLEAELFGSRPEPSRMPNAPSLASSRLWGTRFLDEIEALPLALQSKLLTATRPSASDAWGRWPSAP